MRRWPWTSTMLAIALLCARPGEAQEPGWTGPVVASPQQRQSLDQIDIRVRPYRPFHFYGNAVRRMYYRGTPLPTVRDLTDAAQALMSNQAPPPVLTF